MSERIQKINTKFRLLKNMYKLTMQKCFELIEIIKQVLIFHGNN